MKPANSPLETLFAAARELPTPEARARFLEAACGEDAELRRQLEALLKSDESADSYFQGAGHPLMAQKASEADPTVPESPLVLERTGSVIGRYKLLQKIGEGGMGVVYMAEQEVPIRRRVALKIIKQGMDTRQVVARFEAERQALALMDHPNIARVLDGGATETGRPYFVMELVQGVPITEFCERTRQTAQGRLRLFVKVCEAIQSAHQKGIIHRDIKPSNVLITLHNGDPVPKVIDFGIAKATNQKLTEKTLFTNFASMIGTPAYMSPEQAEMTSMDVDTRSDIYSLGVLLYELLTGTTPFPEKRLRSLAYGEMQRVLLEEEPQKPSTRLSTLSHEEKSLFSRACGHDIVALGAILKGDLDWIVMKCLEKDRQRRYETANALANDVVRHLNNEPVTAYPPSTLYRIQKAVRRNKMAFLAAAGVAMALVAGAVVSTWQAVRARKAEELASRRLTESEAARRESDASRQDAEAIATFLSELLQSPDPARNGRSITVAEMLDQAVGKIDAGLAERPARRALLLSAIADSYAGLGLKKEVVPLREKVRDYHLKTGGLENRATIEATTKVGSAYYSVGRLEEGLRLSQEAWTLSCRVLGKEHTNTLNALQNVAAGMAEMGRKKEALELHQELLELTTKVLGANHRATRKAMSNLSVAYSLSDRPEEALRLRETLLEQSRQIEGPDHPETLLAMNNLGVSLENTRRFAEAARLMEEHVEKARRVFGERHGDYLTGLRRLGSLYCRIGRTDEGLAMARSALRILEQVDGPESRRTLEAMMSLGSGLYAAGRLEEALAIHTNLVRLSIQVLGPDNQQTLRRISNSGLFFRRAGRTGEAVRACEEAVEHCRRSSGPNSTATLYAKLQLVECLLADGRPEDGIRIQRELISLYNSAPEVGDRWDSDTIRDLAFQESARGDGGQALAMFRGLQKRSEKALGKSHPNSLRAACDVVRQLTRLGRDAEALALLHEEIDMARTELGHRHQETITLGGFLADVLAFAGRLPEAIEVLRDLAQSGERRSETWQVVSVTQGWMGQESSDFALGREFLQWAAASSEAADLDRAAKSMSILREAPADLREQALAMAQRSLDLTQKQPASGPPSSRLGVGMAQYRIGRFAEAEASLRKAVEDLDGDSSPPTTTDQMRRQIRGTADLYRAMCLVRLGRPSEAQALLEAGKKSVLPLPKEERRPRTGSIGVDEMILWMAWKEARELVGGDARL